ncbi:MAG TPA: hypothetical protein VKY85_27445 [Candidatus Angelobacter sp.]|nr:hypothetical protein [Candidatus Angelobacter sp.]
MKNLRSRDCSEHAGSMKLLKNQQQPFFYPAAVWILNVTVGFSGQEAVSTQQLAFSQRNILDL